MRWFRTCNQQGNGSQGFSLPTIVSTGARNRRVRAKWEITDVHGFHIPQLISSDPGLSLIEMTVVSPPFILDFVSARIEFPIEYDEEWIAQRMEEFESDWPLVKRVIWGLEEHGIYLGDVHPGNIRCRLVMPHPLALIKREGCAPCRHQFRVLPPFFQLQGTSLSVCRASRTRRTSSTLRPTGRS
jgi:hypothetical protein